MIPTPRSKNAGPNEREANGFPTFASPAFEMRGLGCCAEASEASQHVATAEHSRGFASRLSLIREIVEMSASL